MSADILIVGGGPAGLACAGQLVENCGHQVQILEKQSTVGGRFRSFELKEFPFPVDNCQHILTGSCSESLHFFHRYGGEDLFIRRDGFSIAGDGEVDYVNNSSWPVPFNLAGLYRQLAGISLDSLGAIIKLFRLKNADPNRYPTAGSWLKINQPSRLNRNLWYPLIRSALNEEPARVALEPFKKWVFTGLLSSRGASSLHVPRFCAEEIFTERIASRLEEAGVRIDCNKEVKKINPAAGTLTVSGEGQVEADRIVSAVPSHVLPQLLPEKITNSPRFRGMDGWESSPILSVHLLVEPEISFPAVSFLKDSFFEWLFHDPHQKKKGYLQLVKSAAYRYEKMSAEAAIKRAKEDLQELFSCQLDIAAARAVYEKRATVSLTPAVEKNRFGPDTDWNNLIVAGDWVQTGWPTTLESAVRSGRKAARLLLEEEGEG